MRRLPEAVKRRIVEHLACYCTHAEVSELIGAEFSVTLTPRHVRAYDPSSFQFAGAPHWRTYFQVVRKRCANELGQIAISHRSYRLRQLQTLHDNLFDAALSATDSAKQIEFSKEARAALETAAKEMGNRYVR